MKSQSKCKHCSQPIGFIALRRTGRLIAVDQRPLRPDGHKQLVFADGSVGKAHARLTVGYQAHRATCSGVRRKPTRRQVAERRQPDLIEGYKGCPEGCVGGWKTVVRDGKTGVIPCPVHRKSA